MDAPMRTDAGQRVALSRRYSCQDGENARRRNVVQACDRLLAASASAFLLSTPQIFFYLWLLQIPAQNGKDRRSNSRPTGLPGVAIRYPGGMSSWLHHDRSLDFLELSLMRRLSTFLPSSRSHGLF
ncbi:hypothetical protein J6590_042364 [Homalodisca vitripennis]|nr:hypothetical protein J6590_042364 [Homalodisca vitripennis]